MCMTCVYSVLENFCVFKYHTMYFGKDILRASKKHSASTQSKHIVKQYYVILHNMDFLCGYSVFVMCF